MIAITVLEIVARERFNGQHVPFHIKNVDIPFKYKYQYKNFREITTHKIKERYGSNVYVDYKTEEYD